MPQTVFERRIQYVGLDGPTGYIPLLTMIPNLYNLMSSMSCFTFFYQACQMLAANNEPRSRVRKLGSDANRWIHWNASREAKQAFRVPSRRQFPTGRVFTTRGGSSIGHVAHPALSPLRVAIRRVRWFRFSRFPRASLGLLLYHSITMHAAETLVSSPLGSER